MQLGIKIGCFLLCIVSASSSLAVEPLQGTFGTANTLPPDGVMLAGRGSNSWSGPANGGGGVGNVLNVHSWTGAALGTEWIFDCAVSTSQVVTDNRVLGTGQVLYTTVYGPGTFFLSKNGPWGDTINDLTGTTTSLVRQTTVSFVNGNPVGAVENAATSGAFDGSDCVLTFTIANAIGFGDTDAFPFPGSGYPGLLDTDCSSPRSHGSWGDIISIIMDIDCIVPVDEKVWTQVKELYR
jgi:hypothetical protein